MLHHLSGIDESTGNMTQSISLGRFPPSALLGRPTMRSLGAHTESKILVDLSHLQFYEFSTFSILSSTTFQSNFKRYVLLTCSSGSSVQLARGKQSWHGFGLCWRAWKWFLNIENFQCHDTFSSSRHELKNP